MPAPPSTSDALLILRTVPSTTKLDSIWARVYSKWPSLSRRLSSSRFYCRSRRQQLIKLDWTGAGIWRTRKPRGSLSAVIVASTSIKLSARCKWVYLIRQLLHARPTCNQSSEQLARSYSWSVVRLLMSKRAACRKAKSLLSMNSWMALSHPWTQLRGRRFKRVYKRAWSTTKCH